MTPFLFFIASRNASAGIKDIRADTFFTGKIPDIVSDINFAEFAS